MRKLIAGVDPGTAVGWAVLDLHGNLVALGSRKELGVDSVVAKFVEYGRVIVAGSDKAKIPSFVQEVATKLGAKLVGPSQDLRVDEKRSMTADFGFANAHEMDALSGALTAFKKIQPLLRKIHVFLEREKCLSLFEDVAELVLKEEISIRAAVAILTPKEEVAVVEAEQEAKRDEDVVHLYNSLARARKDNIVLLQRINYLEAKLASAEKRFSELKEKTSGLVKPKTSAEIVKLKDSQIQSLSNKLQNNIRKYDSLKKQLFEFENVLLKNDFVVLPRLARLGWDEVMKIRDSVGSILFVDNVDQFSEKAVSWLRKNGVELIICKDAPKNAGLPFVFLKAQNFRFFGNIVLVDRVWLERARTEPVVLAKVVEEYKKSRINA